MPFRSTHRNSTTKQSQLARPQEQLGTYNCRLWPKFQRNPTKIEDTAGKSRLEFYFAQPLATQQPNGANSRYFERILAYIPAGCGRSFSKIRPYACGNSVVKVMVPAEESAVAARAEIEADCGGICGGSDSGGEQKNRRRH